MIKRLLACLLLLASCAMAQAQTTGPLSKPAQINQLINCFPTQTTGQITPAITLTCLTSIVNSYQQYAAVNPQTGTTYTLQPTDYGQLVTFNNSSAVSVSIPQASGSYFPYNTYVRNLGTGTVTITPTGSTINGGSSYSLAQGQTVWIVSDGTNYQTVQMLNQFAGDQNANTVLAGPTSGSPAAPTFRDLVSADIPPINLGSSANGGVSGTLGNANITNPQITINGTACTLGGTCVPLASASSVTVSGVHATTIIGGSGSGYVISDNSGVLGEVSSTITINSTPCALAGTCSITASASTVNFGGSATGVVSGATNAIPYQNSSNYLTYLAGCDNGVLIYSSSAVPSCSTTIPTATQDNITATGSLGAGTATTGFTIALGNVTLTGSVPVAHGGWGLTTLTSGAIYKGNGTNAPAASALADNSTIISSTEPIDAQGNPFVTEIANAGSTGTTVNKLAKLTGAGTAVIATTSDTGGVVGIVIGGAGTSGNAQIAIAGQASCVFDGGTTENDYVQISSGTNGDCTDVGSTYPASHQVVGRVLSTNASAGTYAILVFGPEIEASTGGGGGGFTSAAVIAGTGVSLSGSCNSTTSISCTVNTPWSISGSDIYNNNPGNVTITGLLTANLNSSNPLQIGGTAQYTTPQVYDSGCGTAGHDCTTAMTSCVAAGPICFLPVGTYDLSSLLTLSGNECVVGANPATTIIRQTTAADSAIKITGINCVKSLTISYPTAGTGGAAILLSSANQGLVKEVTINSPYTGIEISGNGSDGLTNSLSDITILYAAYAGVFITEASNNFLKNVNVINTPGSGLSDAALVIYGNSSGTNVIGGEWYGGSNYSLSIASDGTYTPSYNFITNAFFDSSSKGSLVTANYLSLVGVWFSGGRTGSGYPGLEVENSSAITINGSMFINNGADGIQVDSSSNYVSIMNSTAWNNGVTASGKNGIEFSGNTAYFSALGNVTSYNSGYGILVDNGSSSTCNLTGNIANSNGLGNVVQGSGVSCYAPSGSNP